MEVAGHSEQAADVAVPGFGPEPAGRSVVVAMAAVLPAALERDGLEHLGGSAPAFFGGLRQVAVGQFPSGLRQEMLAGLLILLGRHCSLLLLLLQVSASNLFGQRY